MNGTAPGICDTRSEVRMLDTVNSAEIRKRLRRGEHAHHDTRHIHDLARALAQERLHLKARPPRRSASPDLLWDPQGLAYKVVSRSVAKRGEPTTFDVAASTDADYLLAVFLSRSTFALLEMVRVPWPTVLWLGRATEDRVRLRWSRTSPVFEAAERL